MDHLGIIPDGNRRWAKLNEFSYDESYTIGFKKVIEIIKSAIDFNFTQISVYCLSKENYSRNSEDLNAVYKSESEFLKNDLYDYVSQNNIKVCVFGNFKPLPDYFVDSINNIIKLSPDNPKTVINLLIGYNPIDEILNVLKFNPDNESDIRENLWVKSNIDLLIRTGGGNVPLSNFLPLQCGYASVKIFDVFLNDLKMEQIENCFDEYLNQKKNYGR